MRALRVTLVTLAAAAAMASAVPARAQGLPGTGMPGNMPGVPGSQPGTEPNRTTGGLFGGGTEGLRQLLAVTFTAGGGYDDNVSSEGGALAPSFGLSSRFAQVSAGFNYSLSLANVGVAAAVGSSIAYYPSLVNSATVDRRQASGAAWWQIPFSERTSLSFSVTGQYRPLLYAGSFPVMLDVSGQKPLIAKIGHAYFAEFGQLVDFSLSPVSAVVDPGTPTSIVNRRTWLAGTSFRHNLTRRLDFSASYSYGSMDTTVDNQDTRFAQAGGGITYGLTRYTSLRLGYVQTEHRFTTTTGQRGTHTTRTADIGLSLDRSIALTRSTALGFGASTVALSDGRDDTRYQVNGRIGLTQALGRNWGAHAQFTRDSAFHALLLEPVVSSWFDAGIGGLVGGKLGVSASVGARRGNVGFQAQGNRFDGYFGTAGLQLSVNRYVAAGASYGYYRYDFGQAVVLPNGISRRSDRQSLYAFVSLWAPLIQQRRRP
jgi:hypothetical protein